MRVPTDTQTDTQKDGSDSMTLTADAGGKKLLYPKQRIKTCLIHLNLFLKYELLSTYLISHTSLYVERKVKDVLIGIPKRDLLGMTVAVLQTAGY